jgi:hypothetical protein
MISVERHGDICKPYAIREVPFWTGLRGRSGLTTVKRPDTLCQIA